MTTKEDSADPLRTFVEPPAGKEILSVGREVETRQSPIEPWLNQGAMIRGAVRWIPGDPGEEYFVATSGSGHSLVVGAAMSTAIGPDELLTLALGTSYAHDVVEILRKKHQPLTGYEVLVEAVTRVGPPNVLTAIRIRHRIRGENISDRAIHQAIELSRRKYCSIGVLLDRVVPLEHSIERIEEESSQASPAPIANSGSRR